MSDISLIPVNLATICIESVLYGVFVVLLVVSLWLHIHQQQRHARPPPCGERRYTFITPVSVSSICMLVSNTVHWLAAVVRLFDAFVYFADGTQPLLYYADPSQPTEVVQSGALFFTGIVGDGMLIYRLWMIWGRSKSMIIFPMCTYIGLIVSGMLATYELTQLHIGDDVFVSAENCWLTSASVFTLCSKLYCTGLIAWRIWTMGGDTEKMHVRGTRNLVRTVAIIVESGSLYTMWTILFIVTYQAHLNVQFTVIETWPFAAGIASMLINIRISMGWSQIVDVQMSDVSMSGDSQHPEAHAGATRPFSITSSHMSPVHPNRVSTSTWKSELADAIIECPSSPA